METDELRPVSKKPLPRWAVLIAILVTGGITAIAMSTTGLRGPGLAWESAHDAIESVWTDETQAGAETSAWGAPLAPDNAAMPVAGGTAVPPIVAGVPAIHVDRGICTNCHSVLSPRGGPIPAIASMSTMPHEYRGVCSNCHQFVSAAVPGLASPVAGTAPTPTPRQPTEVEWQGIEAGGSTQGVVVNGAEANARTVGLLRGDVVMSVNGVAIHTMSDFANVTQQGTLAQGTIIVRRNGQRLAFEIGSGWGAPPVQRAQPLNAPATASPSGPFATGARL